MGLPLLACAAAGDVRAGALAALGALAVLYAGPAEAGRSRIGRVALAGIALVLAAVAGTFAAGHPLAAVVVIMLLAGGTAFWTRWRSVPPPGALMPVLVTATTTQIPLAVWPWAPRLGLVAGGVLVACLVVAARDLTRRRSAPPAAAPEQRRPLDALSGAARVALGTGGAALLAVLLGLPRPDWAAVACAAVLVSDVPRATVRRAGHRAMGTVGGIALAGVALSLDLGPLGLVALVVALQFVVELLVVRHYAFAVVFITPLALLQSALATGHLGAQATPLLTARLLETLVGCLVAVAVQLRTPAPRGADGVGGRRFDLPPARPLAACRARWHGSSQMATG